MFKRGLSTRDRKQHAGIRLDDALVECLGALSSKCRDEELEDVVYFILDLYQLHGVPVVLSEVDVDQLVIDLRTALEEHASTSAKRRTNQEHGDEHLFLVLDKNVQGLPWESMPILRGRSVSRIPGIDFLIDRLEMAKMSRGAMTSEDAPVDRATVDPRSAYFVLNPSGDLTATEGRFAPWLGEMKKKAGWKGVVGRAPSEQELLHALENKELVVFVLFPFSQRDGSLTNVTDTLAMAAASSTCVRTRFGICKSVQPRCSGVVLLVRCGTWASSTGPGRLTTTCWPAGASNSLLLLGCRTAPH